MRFKSAAGGRWIAASTLLILSVMAAPVMAQGGPSCNANSFNGLNIGPAGSQNIYEFTESPAGVFQPVTVTLRANKTLPIGGSYVWTQTSGPAVTVTPSASETKEATFQTRDFGPMGATLGFRVSARCSGNEVAAAAALVTIQNVDRPPVVTATASPTNIRALESSRLTAIATDADGDAISYLWKQVSPNPATSGNPVATIGLPSSAATDITAPAHTSDYTLEFEVTATSNAVAKNARAVVNVTAANLPPQVSLTCSNVNERAALSLDGSGTYDPEGRPLSYAWSVLEADAGLDLQLGTESGNRVTRPAPVLGLHMVGGVVVQLRVTEVENPSVFVDAICPFMIHDITNPVISVPADIVAEADSADGKAVAYSVLAQDAVDDEIAYTLPCSPASGSTFGLAAAPAKQNTTAVSCTATDSAGNTATAGFNVTVKDTTGPVITVPGSHGIEATSAAGAIASFLATTADAVDGPGVATCVPATDTQFALGTTPVNCSASDARGNAAAPASFNLTVHDTTEPVVTPPADVEVEATGPLTTVDFGMATATDAVGVTSISHDAPESFPVGITMITWTASDAAGNSGSATSNVTVKDTTPPDVTVPANIVGVEATSADGAVVTFTATASDLVDGDLEATCVPPSGSTFALGTTMVNCTATDLANNEGHAGFSVNVVDTTPPTIDSHDDVGPVEATGATGAAVSYTSPATFDIVDGDGSATCAPLSGSTFALGETTVTCNATDDAGNAAESTSFKVTVVDTTPPVIAPRSDILGVEATGPSGAAVTYARPATSDAVDGPGTASCAPASGSTFALGLTTVTCNAMDAAGNAAVATTFQIGVVDTTAPMVTAPANVTREATGPRTVVVHGTATATDAVGVVNQSHDAPADFPLGTTVITWTATDAAGNTGSATSQVTVTDLTGPAFAAYPATINATASGNSQAAVSFNLPTASDLVDGAVEVTCDRASGSSFNAGSTTVNCSAQDGRTPANVSTMSFVVQVDYTWTGFFRPVDNLPTINVVQAGSAIPVKFNLGGNQGLAIFATGYPNSGSVACGTGPSDVIAATETVTAGGSSLQYDATTGQYNYVWKTEKSWASSCRVLQLTLKDGSVRKALFHFKK